MRTYHDSRWWTGPRRSTTAGSSPSGARRRPGHAGFQLRLSRPHAAERGRSETTLRSRLREDPRSLRAWAGVATVAGQTGSLNWMPREAAIARLEEAALHLQQLDQDDYYTGMSRSFIAFLKGDWENQLVVATLLAQRFKSHPYPFAEYSKRDPAYRASSICTFLRGSDPRFIAGRDLAIETLRELGLP